MINKKTQGKKNRAAGTRFELKVRKDLEEKGWVVSKWMNNVEFTDGGSISDQIYSCKKHGKHEFLYDYNGININEMDDKQFRAEQTLRDHGEDMELIFDGVECVKIGKLIPAKHKFRGPGIPMAIGTGFPDFISYKGIIGFPKKEDECLLCTDGFNDSVYEGFVILGIEVKSNGFLDKTEKEKCKWLLENHIFSKILIASKGEKRGEIIYKEVQK